jgi:hypothetical protein
MKKEPSPWLDPEALKPTAASVLLDDPLEQGTNVGPEDDLRKTLVAMPPVEDVGQIAPGLSDVDHRAGAARSCCGKLGDD